MSACIRGSGMPAIDGRRRVPKAKAASNYRDRIVGYGHEKPDQLLASPKNWRVHSHQQEQVLSEVLDRVGWVQNIIVNQRTGHVVDGHLRVAHAISRGEPTVPVVFIDVDESDEALILATLDPISAMAGRDDELLASLIQDVHIEPGAVADLLASLNGDQPRTDLHEDDADLTPPVEPITRPGDLWLLGEPPMQHRLLCGDSTKAEDVARVLCGQSAEAVITDPPYNVDYDYGDTTDDSKDREHYLAWTKQWFHLAQAATTHCVVLTCGITNLPMWIADVERTHRILAWVKENQNSRNYIGKTSGFNVWEPILVYGKAKKCVARDSFSIPIGIQVAAEGHPCPKSLEAWSRLVDDFTERGDLIFDPFIGAGTTIIAAEQLSRQAYGLEISPAYCDLTVRRWEALTGRNAVLDGTQVAVHA